MCAGLSPLLPVTNTTRTRTYQLGPPGDPLGVKLACRDGKTAKILNGSIRRAIQALLVYTQRNPFNAADAADLLIQLSIGLLMISADAENQESIRQFELMKERTPAVVMERAERFVDQMNINAGGEPIQLELFQG